MLKKINLIKDGCRLEQVTFSVGFLIKLMRYKPDVIWLQEISMANMLYKFKKALGLKFKIVFCDGAPVGHMAAKSFDHIVFLHEFGREAALKDDFNEAKLSVIPHVSVLPEKLISKTEAKSFFSIPSENFVILCVAAWNKHHKRIDYLLKEVATLHQNKVTLFLCGQPETETSELKILADKLNIQVIWKTLNRADLSIAYDSGDLFILPSLTEGLPAVLLEAGFHNLPVICHTHDAGIFIFGRDYIGLTDLSIPGNLSEKIQSLQQSDLLQLGQGTGEIVQAKFNPSRIVDLFVAMIKKVYHE